MNPAKIATEEEVLKAKFLTKLLDYTPESKTVPEDAEYYVQYQRVKNENVKYIYTITNRVTTKEHENEVYTITGKIIDLSNQSENNHVSRMIGYLQGIKHFKDNLRPTEEEQHVIKYNESLYLDPERKSIKALYKNTFLHLFYNNLASSINNIKNLLSCIETKIIIIDENSKRSVTNVVKGATTMVMFPNNISTVSVHEKPQSRNSLKFIRDSDTTKSLKAIQKNIQTYPQIAKDLGTSKEQIDNALNMSSLHDSIATISESLTNDYGNNMVKPQVIEEIEAALKHMLSLFSDLKLVNNEKVYLDDKLGQGSNKRVKQEDDETDL